MLKKALQLNIYTTFALVVYIVIMSTAIVYAGGGTGSEGDCGAGGGSAGASASTGNGACAGDGGGDSNSYSGGKGSGEDDSSDTGTPAPKPAPTASITCSPSSVDDGEPAIVSWSCGHSKSSAGDGFNIGGSTSGKISVFPVQDTTTYKVTCNSSHNSSTATDSCSVALNAAEDPEGWGEEDPEGGEGPQDPEIPGTFPGDTQGGGWGSSTSWFQCFPRFMTEGETARIRWNCADSDDSEVRNTTTNSFVHEGSPGYGEAFVTPSNTTQYELYCADEDFTASCQIAIGDGPAVDITADPVLVVSGTQTRVTWSSIGVDDCTVSGPNLSSSETAGTELVTVTTESVFTITCDGEHTDSVTVRVPSLWQEQ